MNPIASYTYLKALVIQTILILKLLDDDWEFLDFNRLNFCLSLVIQYSNKKVVSFESDNRTQENDILDMLPNDLCEYL